MPAWVEKELLTELRHEKEAHKRWQHGEVTCEEEYSNAVLSEHTQG